MNLTQLNKREDHPFYTGFRISGTGGGTMDGEYVNADIYRLMKRQYNRAMFCFVYSIAVVINLL